MTLKLLHELLLLMQLLLDHIQIFCMLLLGIVILSRHFELDIIFLQLLDLLVEVVELGLVLLDFLLVLGDPFLVFGGKFDFIFFQLLDLSFPLIVAFRLKQLNLSLQLLNNVVFLIELHRVEPLSCKVTALVAIYGGKKIFGVVAA